MSRDKTKQANKFGQQLDALIKYLNIKPAVFAKRCDFIRNKSIPLYISGDIFPTLETIDKIRQTYPVTMEWLCYAKGEMWQSGKDYFQERFENYDKKTDTLKEKTEALLEVFECNGSELGRRLGVSKDIINYMKNGQKTELEAKYILLFRSKIEFIPYEWYL